MAKTGKGLPRSLQNVDFVPLKSSHPEELKNG